MNKLIKAIKEITKNLWEGGKVGYWCERCQKKPLWTCFRLHHFFVKDFTQNSWYYSEVNNNG